MDLKFKGRIVAVTGSSRGIGRAIAREFLLEGANVVLTGRDQKTLNQTFKEMGMDFGPDHVSKFRGDLCKVSRIHALAEWLNLRYGRLDHLVCNIGSGRSVPPLQENDQEWDRLLDINLRSAVRCVKELMSLLESGQASASITFVSSICGIEVLGCPVVYASAKSALQNYAKNIARPLGKKGIRVNVVSPGNILFAGSVWERKLKEDPSAVEDMLNREVPLARLADAEEIAKVVVFLASPAASFVTGANWIVDGGQTRSF